MTPKKWGIFLLIMAIVAVLVIGCGGKQTAPPTNPPVNEEPAEEPVVEEPVAEEPEEDEAEEDEPLVDGVYVGVGQGFGGDIKLEVTVANGEITKIEVIEHNETETIGGVSFEELIQSALSSHDENYDSVSGATKTSDGFWEAIEDVHNQATM